MALHFDPEMQVTSLKVLAVEDDSHCFIGQPHLSPELDQSRHGRRHRTPAAKYLVLDAHLARGLSYYTGPIFEIRSDDFSGSLGGGGRYDELIGMFMKRSVPACGFSLGVERILFLMEERGMVDDSNAELGLDDEAIEFLTDRRAGEDPARGSAEVLRGPDAQVERGEERGRKRR